MTTAESSEQSLDTSLLAAQPLLGADGGSRARPLASAGAAPRAPIRRDDSQGSMMHASEAATGNGLRERLQTLVERPESSAMALAFQTIIVLLILASTCAAVLETVPEMRNARVQFFWLEAVVTVLFSLELGLRYCACTSTAAFLTNGFNTVDFLAILPGVVQLWMVSSFGSDVSMDKHAKDTVMSLRMVRLMWLVRILRLAKVARYSQWLSVCIVVLTRRHSSILLVVGLLLALMVVSSSLLYLVEMDRCESIGVPCRGFESIPDACWFAISTLTTVGYGDVIPSTALGKIIAGFFSVCAVMTLALAGALLTFDFAEHFREERERSRLELQGSLHQGRSEEFQEIQALVDECRGVCDGLVARLAVAASRRPDKRSGRSVPLVAVPMLRLIEDRARILCAEVQSCAYAWALDNEDKGDIQTLLTYTHDEAMPDDNGLDSSLLGR
mmetsp:Transcript_62854/g.161789  ORF Transcript_62854/g.161789 Transcript_62854/m.161789 type:complete len:444 (+) Transcript_62854:68-1399(+)|eukprot:CAMPEP_0195054114 /NCGR_PEP_ID=MMETSP0448-20130528/3088_1 /TAXON_ID=66468 /ORGANISM="Heterocapsa triquestra, Strain CCMP 448" /LENGTH=443 /DNA_ID=CAMNT_0040083533 /DNA_START=67 /DNA_END=1398 /DNA_ORIENTATION=-